MRYYEVAAGVIVDDLHGLQMFNSDVHGAQQLDGVIGRSRAGWSAIGHSAWSSKIYVLTWLSGNGHIGHIGHNNNQIRRNRYVHWYKKTSLDVAGDNIASTYIWGTFLRLFND